MIGKIKLDLFKLKSKEDLEGVYQFFKKNTRKWFNDNQNPKEKFFHLRKCPLCNGDTSKEAFKIDGFFLP